MDIAGVMYLKEILLLKKNFNFFLVLASEKIGYLFTGLYVVVRNLFFIGNLSIATDLEGKLNSKKTKNQVFNVCVDYLKIINEMCKLIINEKTVKQQKEIYI